MADEEGASPRELVLEACRRNNTSLLEETLADLASAAAKAGKKHAEYVAGELNTAADGMGNGCLHVAVLHGSYDVLDLLLDQEGLEIDEHDRMEGDTPLHKAVRHTNALGQDGWEAGGAIVDILLDAGCDPRIRNKAKLRPVDLVDPRNLDLRKELQKGEYVFTAGDDVVVEDDDAPGGSATDSD